jgi:hypothetical protein
LDARSPGCEKNWGRPQRDRAYRKNSLEKNRDWRLEEIRLVKPLKAIDNAVSLKCSAPFWTAWTIETLAMFTRICSA